MSATKGYYSVIQYCPDASRMEAANIGVLLLCPDIKYIDTRLSKNNSRVRHFFQKGSYDLDQINAAKKALENRIKNDATISNFDKLELFINSRGNDIILTQPRAIKIVNAQDEIERLFEELVEVEDKKRNKVPEELENLFRDPSLEGRIKFDTQITIPVVGTEMKIPYAYQNGVLNLVKPQHFSEQESSAKTAAIRLALHGDILRRHPIGDIDHKLIVYPVFEPAHISVIRPRVDSILKEYDIRCIHQEELLVFAKEVETQAHL